MGVRLAEQEEKKILVVPTEDGVLAQIEVAFA